MRRIDQIAIVAMVACTTWACSGGSYPSSPAAPTSAPPAAGGAGVVTVNIVGIHGALSFSPNPATLPAGEVIVWHNVDTVTHRVVLNDGSVDTGNLAPGASSPPMNLRASSSPYHCSIHPEMVGSINQTTAESVPAAAPY